MQRTFVVVEEEDEYGEIILSLAALEVRGRGGGGPAVLVPAAAQHTCVVAAAGGCA